LKEIFNTFILNLKNTSIIEWIAVISNLLYVILIAKEKIIGWVFGFLGASLYTYICYTNQLFLESSLQIFYVLMAIIGYINWNIGSSNASLKIIEWSIKKHIFSIFILVIFVFIIGYIFNKYTSQQNPYIDAFTTVFSLFTTYLVTIKILSNWLYWIIINLFSIYLYFENGLILTSFLYILMTLFAYYGWKSWQKKMNLND
jgi:nicotinamide mononucleotide transporter